MRPLVQNHALELADFLRYAHDVDVEKQLAPDEDLQCPLDCVHSPKVIFTNAPRAYAQRVLERLGIARRFARVFDYEFGEYVGKPNAVLYDQVQAALGVPGDALVMVDDALKNLVPAHTLGWRTVWVNPRGAESSSTTDFIVGDLWQVANAFRQLGLLDARHHVMAEHRLAGCAWAKRA